MLRHARNVRGRPLQAASGAVDVIAGHRNNGSSSSADREQGAATPPPPPTLPVVSADGSFCGPASNAHATQVARRPRGAPAAQWRSFAAAPLTREVPGTSAWPTVHHHVPRQRHSGGRHLPGQHSGGGHLPGRHSGSGHLPERHSGSGQLPGHNAAAAADALQQQLLPDGDRRALEAMAFWSGGEGWPAATSNGHAVFLPEVPALLLVQMPSPHLALTLQQSLPDPAVLARSRPCH